jgi:hypothetical protein
MMTCREVSTLLASGDLASASLGRRLAIRLHLLMCDRCSTFSQWLEGIAAASRSLALRTGREAPADLESRVLERLDRDAGVP